MTIEKFSFFVYVILGIDAQGHDQVIAVRRDFPEAKHFCTKCLGETEFYDLWIEKHEVP